MGPKTSHRSGDFGAPADFPSAGAYPTNSDVIAAVNHEIEKSVSSKDEKEKEAIQIVKDLVINKFREVSPLVSIIEQVASSK